jgi:hypothetical protein
MDARFATHTDAKSLKKHLGALGHAMRFDAFVITTAKAWNYKREAMDHYAAIYTDTGHGLRLEAECDETFTDEGHATAWALGMIADR